MFVNVASRSVFRLVAFALIGSLAGLLSYLRAEANPSGIHAPIAGAARVVDGDTIAIGGIHIRLEGIDAPETSQTCGRSLSTIETWPCGTAASAALEHLLQGRTVSCDPKGLDKYGRTLATCFVDGIDVNAEMVRRGLAWAFVKYSRKYAGLEAAARAARIGVWQGDATAPWEYRQQQWAVAETEAPRGCAIKGNAGRNGAIYHMPWSSWYGKVRMDTNDAHKRWFCSETEAINAGFRPARSY